MPQAIYTKKPPKIQENISLPVFVADQNQNYSNAVSKKKERLFYFAIFLVGLFSMLFAIWPLVVWYLKTLPRLTAKVDEFPIPQSEVIASPTYLVANVQVVKDPDGFSYFATNYRPKETKIEEFSITIPKLEIKKAIVKVDTLKFDKNLSHFPGSALPGEVGNSFITGHSVLPQFADPKNYRAIFTKLSDLTIGDEVLVEIEGKKLQFIVQYSKVVSPHDFSVLNPISKTGRNLTLMTCVPPGTNTKRLIVVTSLI